MTLKTAVAEEARTGDASSQSVQALEALAAHDASAPHDADADATTSSHVAANAYANARTNAHAHAHAHDNRNTVTAAATAAITSRDDAADAANDAHTLQSDKARYIPDDAYDASAKKKAQRPRRASDDSIGSEDISWGNMTNDLTFASVHSKQDNRSVRDEIVAAFTLTLRVSIFAIVGLTQVFYWLVRLLVFDLHMGDDPIFVPTTKLGIFVHHATLVLTFGFLPAMLAAYSRMHPLRAFLIFYVPIITWAIVWDLVPLAAIWKLCIPYAYIPLALRIFVVSKQSSLPRKAISFFVSLLLGNMLVIFVNANDLSKSTVKRILFTSILVPLIKELTASWFRSSTRSLVTKADAAIGRTNRGVPWAQLLLIQIVWAVYGRMLFSEAEDDTVLTVIVIMQGATEISLRLSIRWRDQKVRTAKRFIHAVMYYLFGLPHPDQHDSVLIVPDSNIFREVGTRNRDGIERVFYGMVVLCDMLAEYIAILMVPLIILTFRTRIILIPLNYYSNQFDAVTPFQGIDVWPLARWTALQLATELIVDALCIAYERKHLKIDLERLWSRRPSSFVPWVMFASLGAAPFVYLTLDTDLCNDPGKNYCNCANGNGLSSGGLLQKYCEQLYPLTFGIPYNTSAIP